MSNKENVSCHNLKIYGGDEDCVDIVRGSNHTFENCVFHCGDSQQAFTIKAGASDITIKNCTFKGKPSIGYIVLGQYSDYDFCKTIKTRRINVINCTFEHEDATPIISCNADASTMREFCHQQSFEDLLLYRKIFDRFKSKKWRDDAYECEYSEMISRFAIITKFEFMLLPLLCSPAQLVRALPTPIGRVRVASGILVDIRTPYVV